MVELLEIIAPLSFAVMGILVNRVFHYRNLWMQAKRRVSWTMPSNKPENWVVVKNFSPVGNPSITYDVADKDTNVRVAKDFMSEISAREYIAHHQDMKE